MSRCRTDKAGDKRRQVKSNDKLPAERELASTLGVSRVPVRETLGMLRILGIIETGYGKGAVVKGLEKSRLLETIDMLVESKKDTRVEVTEARAVLEVAAVKIASLKRTEADLDRLRTAVRQMEEEIRSRRLPVESSLDFHRGVMMATKNKLLFRMLMLFQDLINETREASLRIPDRPQSALREHAAILKAIEEKDATTAVMLMERHLDITYKGVEGLSHKTRN